MVTAMQRYRNHKAWETLSLKRDALRAARFDSSKAEQWRNDLVEWLDEAVKSQVPRQPAMYLPVLDEAQQALNAVPIDQANFEIYVGLTHGYGSPASSRDLLVALRALPLPAPRDLTSRYVELLDKEVEARTTAMDDLRDAIAVAEQTLAARQAQVKKVEERLNELTTQIQTAQTDIEGVSSSAAATIESQWKEALDSWRSIRAESDSTNNAAALEHLALLAATAKAGSSLAEHAAGNLSATEWTARAKRERRSARWLRAGGIAAFAVAAAVGFYIVHQALENDFDLTLGDGALRSTIAIIIGAFGGLLLRESSGHFREANTAEDVSLSLVALAPFYAGSKEEVKLAARVQVGDAVLVKNVLSRFAHRDAAKHSGEINTAELPELVREAARALKVPGTGSAPSGGSST